MNVRLTPARLQGSVAPPLSKSDAHRLLIAAALSDREALIHLQSGNDDIASTLRCLCALGAQVIQVEDGLRMRPICSPQEMPLLNCGESGSTLRFIAPIAAALRGAVMTGSGRLGERPMEPLLSLLRAHGCEVSGEGLPLRIVGGLQNGVYALRGDISSQFVSGLLYALPLLAGDSEIHLTTPLQSKGYVDMTLRALRRFGVAITEKENGFYVPGGQRYKAPEEELRPEGDWSGAAFWYGANYLGCNVNIAGLDADSTQGDKEIARLVQRLPDVIDVADIPDLLPILSVMACKKTGETRFVNAARLRIKESDRLDGCEKMIVNLGGSAYAKADSLTVHGSGALLGGTVDGRNDHRMVMAAAIASCICAEPVVIWGAQAVNKSYPDFFRDFEQLGGKIHVL